MINNRKDRKDLLLELKYQKEEGSEIKVLELRASTNRGNNGIFSVPVLEDREALIAISQLLFKKSVHTSNKYSGPWKVNRINPFDYQYISIRCDRGRFTISLTKYSDTEFILVCSSEGNVWVNELQVVHENSDNGKVERRFYIESINNDPDKSSTYNFVYSYFCPFEVSATGYMRAVEMEGKSQRFSPDSHVCKVLKCERGYESGFLEITENPPESNLNGALRDADFDKLPATYRMYLHYLLTNNCDNGYCHILMGNTEKNDSNYQEYVETIKKKLWDRGKIQESVIIL